MSIQNPKVFSLVFRLSNIHPPNPSSTTHHDGCQRVQRRCSEVSMMMSFLAILFALINSSWAFVSTRHCGLACLSPPAPSTSRQFLVPDDTFLIAATEPWVQPLALVLGPFLNWMSFSMLARVVLSWYPEQSDNKKWGVVVVPTEPLLRAVRGWVPPAFGVDITPIFWLAIFTFVNEIMLGQQGLLTMKLKYGI